MRLASFATEGKSPDPLVLLAAVEACEAVSENIEDEEEVIEEEEETTEEDLAGRVGRRLAGFRSGERVIELAKVPARAV